MTFVKQFRALRPNATTSLLSDLNFMFVKKIIRSHRLSNKMRFLKTLPLLAVLFSTTAHPQDGQQLYSLYCSACHGIDGKGAGNGTFPPLAGSPWVHGNPKRTIAIVLHGLKGPIEVNGKAYNLEMPPQGAALQDEQITAIVNYVHSGWGNRGEPIRKALVSVVREEFKDRQEQWTSGELLELFPLPKIETPLENLTSRVYKGQWDQLPDFQKIQSENIEEEHSGLLNVSLAGMKDNFGIVWEGDFVAKEAGEYEFLLAADDGARLILNNLTVATVNGRGGLNEERTSKGKTSLLKGANSFRVEYFEAFGKEEILLKYRLANSGEWTTLSENRLPGAPLIPSIPLAPENGKAAIYRNFIEGTTPRAIGFGFPGGLNMAYSADHLAPELLWTGDFIDAGRHWTNRGHGNQKPAGENVTTLTQKRYLPPEARFAGYTLDQDRNPTFKVKLDDQTLADSWKPDSNRKLLRTLSLTGGQEPLTIDLGENTEITPESTITLQPGETKTIEYTLR